MHKSWSPSGHLNERGNHGLRMARTQSSKGKACGSRGIKKDQENVTYEERRKEHLDLLSIPLTAGLFYLEISCHFCNNPLIMSITWCGWWGNSMRKVTLGLTHHLRPGVFKHQSPWSFYPRTSVSLHRVRGVELHPAGMEDLLMDINKRQMQSELLLREKKKIPWLSCVQGGTKVITGRGIFLGQRNIALPPFLNKERHLQKNQDFFRKNLVIIVFLPRDVTSVSSTFQS